MSMSLIGTIIVVVSKGTLAGIGSALVYKFLRKHNYIVAIVAASIVTPLINSLVYRIGMVTFFHDYFFGKAGNKHPIAYFMEAFIKGGFFLEVGISTFFSPLVVRICDLCFDKLGIKVDRKQKNIEFK